MTWLSLSWHSLWNRRLLALLTMLSIAISAALLMSIERIRADSKASFANSISGTDLIVGARTSPLQLVLYSVFHLGDATNNIRYSSYQQLSQAPQVKWSIPLALGDSHQGYRVVGTDQNFFDHFQYGQQQHLTFADGQSFHGVTEVVLGAQVAKEQGYQLGQALVIAHGSGKTSFSKHDNLPFTVVGILAPTGTPVDRALWVPLEGIEAIHYGWDSGQQQKSLSQAQLGDLDLAPKQLTAALFALNNRIQVLQLQRQINTSTLEPLTAALPGVTLQQLWQMMNVGEQALRLVAVLVVAAGLIGMLTMLLANLNERRREMALLRAVGASRWHIFALLMGEALLLTVLALLMAFALLAIGSQVAAGWLLSQYGIALSSQLFTISNLKLCGWILVAASLIGTIPAFTAYHRSLADGMSVRH